MDYASILKNPRITEKATRVSERGVYTFNVSPQATKNEIRNAVKSLFKVTPRKIAIVITPVKSTFIRGKKGTKGGGKKAMVYLKKGDKIEFI